MARWYEADPNRHSWELEELKREGYRPQVNEAMRERGLLDVRVEAPVNGQVTPFRLVFPTGFPHFRPTVFAESEAIGRHQNPFGRFLCVVENGDQGWNASMYGSHMVARAVKLLEDTAAGPAVLHDAEVDAPEPVSAYLMPHQEVGSAFLFPEEVGARLPKGQAWGQMTVRVSFEPTPRAVLTELKVMKAADGTPKGPIAMQADVTQTLVDAVGARVTKHGFWVKVDAPPPLHLWRDEPDRLWSRLLAWAKESCPDLPSVPTLKQGLAAVIYPDEGPIRGAYQPNWAVLLRHQDAGSVRKCRSPMETHALRPFAIAGGGYGRVPIVAALAGKRVLLIGAGSVGGAIAIELGRAGVGAFTIYDQDVATPPNVVRQEVDLSDIGLPKPMVLERRLKFINPRIQVKKRCHPIGGVALDDPLRATAIHNMLVEDIRAADLVIVATGETAPMRHINDLAILLGKPVLFAWVLSGAWGGHVFLAMPGAACYECLDWHTAEGSVLTPNEPAVSEVVYHQGCGLPSFTGAGFDVKAISVAATRYAVQAFVNDPAVYPGTPGNHLVVNNRAEANGSPPSVVVETIHPHARCNHYDSHSQPSSS